MAETNEAKLLRERLQALVTAVENESRTFLVPARNHPMSHNVRWALAEAKQELEKQPES